MHTLYVTDLDGTLLGSDGRVSPLSVSILNKAVAKGASFTVATARTPATVSSLLSGIDMRLPAIVMTGAALWHPATGVYSEARHISPSTVDDLLNIYSEEGLPTFLYTLRNNHIDIYHLGSMSPQERTFMDMRRGNPYKSFNVGTDGRTQGAIPTDDVILLFAMQEEEPVKRVYHRIVREVKGCNPLHYHDTYGPESELMEVFAADATKGEAIRRLRRLTGADRIEDPSSI